MITLSIYIYLHIYIYMCTYTCLYYIYVSLLFKGMCVVVFQCPTLNEHLPKLFKSLQKMDLLTISLSCV